MMTTIIVLVLRSTDTVCIGCAQRHWHDEICLNASFSAFGLPAPAPHPPDPVMPSHDDMGNCKDIGLPRDQSPCRI